MSKPLPPLEGEETPEREAAPLVSEVQHELHEDAGPDEARRTPHDPLEVLRIPDFRRYLTGGICAAAGSQMTSVAAGWELYQRTRDPGSLAILGLMAAIPVISLALPAGSLADRKNRKRIVVTAQFCSGVILLLLCLASATRAPLPLFYLLILGNAICQAFSGPASQALAVGLVPPVLLPAAMKLSSIRWQLAATLGPILGGFLIQFAGQTAPLYALDALGRLVFCLFLLPVCPRPQEAVREVLNWASVSAGWQFIKGQPLILSTITLDMVAVLFGGATALLPVFADDLLKVGETGLGYLRAAPAIGAVCMALVLTWRPPMQKAGKAMLGAVAGFGLATIVFGLAPLLPSGVAFPVALAALFSLGALDNISVVVRHTLLQVVTPDSMRGRVSAVNSVFIGTSNEIGEVESGAAAKLFGTIPAVVAGGIITILVVQLVQKKWPQVAGLGSLEDAAREARGREGTRDAGELHQNSA